MILGRFVMLFGAILAPAAVAALRRRERSRTTDLLLRPVPLLPRGPLHGWTRADHRRAVALGAAGLVLGMAAGIALTSASDRLPPLSTAHTVVEFVGVCLVFAGVGAGWWGAKHVGRALRRDVRAGSPGAP